MMRNQMRRWLTGGATSLVAACVLALNLGAAAATVPDAAMNGDRDAVRQLLKQGADVNAVQGDGVTALHWAATRGDAEMASMLLVAGANHRAATRFGGYQPLHVAAERGSATVVRALVTAGADANATTVRGTTPLMLAAAAGDTETLGALLEAGAQANARETERGHTALMFAAAANRLPAVKLLLARGADPAIATKLTDLSALSQDGSNPEGRTLANTGPGGAPAPRPARPRQRAASARRGPRPAVLLQRAGARTGWHGAAAFRGPPGLHRRGAGADRRRCRRQPDEGRRPGVAAAHRDGQRPLRSRLPRCSIAAPIPNLAAENGVTPLYAVLNLRWAQEAGYPQPWAHLDQKTGYLAYMKRLLDKGADPNLRLSKKVWYSGYNFDLSGIDEVGATPFWRAAYGADVDAMKLLVAYGADPWIPTAKPPGRPRTGDADIRQLVDVSGMPEIPVGGPGIPALLAATGVGYSEGFAANSHRYSPGGMLAAVKYMVEELGLDVNARDHEGNTALHHAASRGDNEMILYLVSKGADPKVVNREGQTTVDMANGPVQRTQPYPETIKLLEGMGAKNNHKCVSC